MLPLRTAAGLAGSQASHHAQPLAIPKRHVSQGTCHSPAVRQPHTQPARVQALNDPAQSLGLRTIALGDSGRHRHLTAAAAAVQAAEEIDALLSELPDEVVESALARPDAPNLDRGSHRQYHLDQVERALAEAGYA